MSSLFNLLSSGKIIHKKAKLLIDLELDNGETRKIGDIVDILIDKGQDYYHAEDNNFACTVHKSEIEFIN